MRKALVVLQSILAHAVAWGHVQTNAAAVVRKPSGKRIHTVVVLPPAEVERIRTSLIELGQLRDATLVSVLAYAGLRPQEALALRWGHVRDRTLLIDQALSDGDTKATKTGNARSVRLLAPVAADLAEWRLASGRPDPNELVFPTASGAAWRGHDWANWRRRVFQPTAKLAGSAIRRPYDLRHSFCSLLIHEGMSVVEVAKQAGHSPAMTLSTYAHVMADLEGAERVSAEAAIRACRETKVSGKCPPALRSATT